ncbi:hypothetical protein [Clostridium beijerinckii]|uniref:Uncharacterized protein n=1 Tax=Clostridium beijerinckii TaxID=1520 RepID=A0AAW3W964_CLOBE|nr:hypothetical protein [Clostridium beijerinckii]MBC2458160.1 hypothetical protein [Clostridium beijerinckii]MBC2475355.1 hypothetical protein [Clostridium beijerinckii]NOV62573.1 hypothetical protein [Clostridium beijerinckii]NOV70466.1 hypothetical protein [Clostridium beijerinckii]NOW30625.1 hypothetical protein [Clostridium beijerinckii]
MMEYLKNNWIQLFVASSFGFMIKLFWEQIQKLVMFLSLKFGCLIKTMLIDKITFKIRHYSTIRFERREFDRIVKEYNETKKYNLGTYSRLKNFKYLTPKQKIIREQIIEVNKEIISKELEKFCIEAKQSYEFLQQQTANSILLTKCNILNSYIK